MNCGKTMVFLLLWKRQHRNGQGHSSSVNKGAVGGGDEQWQLTYFCASPHFIRGAVVHFAAPHSSLALPTSTTAAPVNVADFAHSIRGATVLFATPPSRSPVDDEDPSMLA
eukprot:CAMPEP_0172327812 /NCGR_PEP_ID=MMETSP1058-20130122/60022_1 /TAXON_ID=83371 /ORGANISM="Detonula confervacea, Strain CCMP 353" /LENGTH=110 /DNA_ID=CAMNT_0013044897 /DNA_START=3027 /DNA_END=3355 /DNA_ORIENTATION=+